jgi:hypothetical protein
MATLLQELSEIVSILNENDIEYAICGGLALTIHGFPRATFDIDVLIQSESLETAYKVTTAKGYNIKGLDMSFKEGAVEIRRVSKIDDDGEVLSLDLLLVTPQVIDIWETREKLFWENQDLWIVSQAGLIKMKQLAGRAKDLIDIDRLQNEED